MADFSVNGSINSSFQMILSVWENSVDIANNKSNVGWKLVLKSTGSYSFSLIGSTIVVNIGGNEVYNQYSQKDLSAGNSIEIGNGSLDIIHDNDGRKTITCSASYTQSTTANYTPGNMSLSENFELTQIARYANISVTQRAKDINSISINWTSDSVRDHTQYKVDGGSWIDAGDTVASDNKSGYFVINNLNYNTSYKITVRIKRTDSQLWTESEELTISTYDYARFISVSDSVFGDDINISKYNESGLSNRLDVYVENTIIISREDISDIYMLTLIQSELDSLYKKISVESSILNCTYKLITICNSVQYEDILNKNIILTGNAKTCKLKNDGSIKRAKVFVKQDEDIKRAVLFVKMDGILKRCI